MGGVIIPFTTGLFISAGISTALGVYIQRWRGISGIWALTIQLIAQIVWALGFAFEAIVPDPASKLWMHKIAWIGILLVPTFWMLFILQYTRDTRWLNRWVYAGVALPVFFLLAGLFTNDLHHLFWSSTTLLSESGARLVYERGPIFWIATGFGYSLVILTLVKLVWAASRVAWVYNRQVIQLLFAACIPLATNLLFVLNITQSNNWTPLAFILTNLLILASISRFRLFNLVPIARGQIFDILSDGFLVLDMQNRVIDANLALLSIAGAGGKLVVGEPVEDLFAAKPELLEGILRIEGGDEILLNDRTCQRHYSLLRSPLRLFRNSAEGLLLIFRDVTFQQQVELRLRSSEESLRRLFEANPYPQILIGTDESTIYASNHAFLEFFQTTLEEVLHRSATELITSRDKIMPLLEEVGRTGKFRGQVEILRGPNDVRACLLTVDPVDYLGDKRLLVSVVDISERLRFEQVEHEQRVFADVLRETGSLINGTLDLDEVLNLILVNLQRVVKYDVANIMLVNAQGMAYVARTRGYTERNIDSPFGKTWLVVEATPNLRWMVENRQPEKKNDVSRDPSWILAPGEDWLRAHLGAPIITTLGVAGFINLDSTQPNYYSETDAERLMIFANQTGVAINNARLYASIQKAAHESEVLQEITLAASSSLDFDQVIQRIFDLVERMVPSDSAGVEMIDGKEVVLKALRGFSNNDVVLGTRWALAGTANERVWQSRIPMIFADVQAEFSEYRIPPHNQIRSILMIPLIAGGEVIGFLSLDSWVLAHYGEEDLRLANLFAGNIAAALENARLYEEARRRAGELEILNRAGMAVTSGLDLNHVLLVLYEQCRQVMPADSFYVALYHEESGDIEFPLFQDQGIFRQVQPLNIKSRKGMAVRVIEEARTIYLPDTLDSQAPEQYQLIRYGGIPTRAYLGVPLFLREKAIGVISMQSVHPNAYSPDQIQLLETISTQTVIAIENARLYMQAQAAATTDELTGLLSRRELFRRAEQEIERAIRYRHNLAVLMIDIDHFKGVNDTFGHLAGDQVLRSLGRVCQENMRLVDVVGRYGGEEILILMPETTAEQAFNAAERLRKQVEEMIETADGSEIRITVSIGVAGLPKDAGLTLEAQILRADTALFAAKALGRNRVWLAEE
jgi:diguanylate cyclase (GGDEF)-like protein